MGGRLAGLLVKKQLCAAGCASKRLIRVISHAIRSDQIRGAGVTHFV